MNFCVKTGRLVCLTIVLDTQDIDPKDSVREYCERWNVFELYDKILNIVTPIHTEKKTKRLLKRKKKAKRALANGEVKSDNFDTLL